MLCIYVSIQKHFNVLGRDKMLLLQDIFLFSFIYKLGIDQLYGGRLFFTDVTQFSDGQRSRIEEWIVKCIDLCLNLFCYMIEQLKRSWEISLLYSSQDRSKHRQTGRLDWVMISDVSCWTAFATVVVKFNIW